jgi:septation ring formation regulator EzrA
VNRVDNVEVIQQIAKHEQRLDNIEKNQRDSEDRIMEQIRNVQFDMRTEIAKFDAKLENIDRKIDGAFSNLRKSVPTWASVLIAGLGVLFGIKHGGW